MTSNMKDKKYKIGEHWDGARSQVTSIMADKEFIDNILKVVKENPNDFPNIKFKE